MGDIVFTELIHLGVLDQSGRGIRGNADISIPPDPIPVVLQQGHVAKIIGSASRISLKNGSLGARIDLHVGYSAHDYTYHPDITGGPGGAEQSGTQLWITKGRLVGVAAMEKPTRVVEAAGWKGVRAEYSIDLATEDDHLRAAIKQHVTEQALADMIGDRDYLSLAEFCRDNLWTSIRVARIAALHLAAAEVDPFLAALSNAVQAAAPPDGVI